MRVAFDRPPRNLGFVSGSFSIFLGSFPLNSGSFSAFSGSFFPKKCKEIRQRLSPTICLPNNYQRQPPATARVRFVIFCFSQPPPPICPRQGLPPLQPRAATPEPSCQRTSSPHHIPLAILCQFANRHPITSPPASLTLEAILLSPAEGERIQVRGQSSLPTRLPVVTIPRHPPATPNRRRLHPTALPRLPPLIDRPHPNVAVVLEGRAPSRPTPLDSAL